MYDPDDQFEDTENDRRIANIVRMGTIAAVDHAKARVKVLTEEILTDWLPWLTMGASSVADWFPPEAGEQVVLLAPSGEIAQGIVILGGAYKTDFPAPSSNPKKRLIKFPDGSIVEYDFESHELTVTSTGKINLTAATEINLTAPLINITGSIQLEGDGQWSGDITHTGGNLSSHGKVLHTHTHPDPDGGNTGPPN